MSCCHVFKTNKKSFTTPNTVSICMSPHFSNWHHPTFSTNPRGRALINKTVSSVDRTTFHLPRISIFISTTHDLELQTQKKSYDTQFLIPLPEECSQWIKLFYFLLLKPSLRATTTICNIPVWSSAPTSRPRKPVRGESGLRLQISDQYFTSVSVRAGKSHVWAACSFPRKPSPSWAWSWSSERPSNVRLWLSPEFENLFRRE